MKKICLLLSVISAITMLSGCEKQAPGQETEPTTAQEELAMVSDKTFENQENSSTIEVIDTTKPFQISPIEPVTVSPGRFELEGIGDFDIDLSDITIYDKIETPQFKMGEIGDFDIDLSDIPVYDTVQPVDFGDFNINFNVDDIEKLKQMDETELQAIAAKQMNLFGNLQSQFQSRGLAVSVDPVNGTLSLDSAVLFGGDSAYLSQEGKDFLDRFMTAYTTVAYDRLFDGFVAKVMVEGHIAPIAGTTYEGGMPLSTQRATNVRDYCLSEEIGLSADKIAKLEEQLEAVGLSNSCPVRDADGNVDIPASRRVSFRFIIQID